jgi:predicted DNA-binding transcriptional regulator AlpA
MDSKTSLVSGSLALQPARQAYGVNEVAALLGVSRATLYNAWKGGAGPRRIRIRGRVLVSHDSLSRWLTALEETKAGGA